MSSELSSFYGFVREQEVSVVYAGEIIDEMLQVTLRSKNKEWNLFIENEYDDFDINNQPVCIYLTLRALDDYRIEGDYKSWIGYFSLENNEHWKNYYEYLGNACNEIEALWGEIDTFIKDEDYLMCDGAYVELLKSND